MNTTTLIILFLAIAWLELNVFFLVFMYEKSCNTQKSRFVQDIEFLEGFYANDGVNIFVCDCEKASTDGADDTNSWTDEAMASRVYLCRRKGDKKD